MRNARQYFNQNMFLSLKTHYEEDESMTTSIWLTPAEQSNYKKIFLNSFCNYKLW